MDKSKNAVVKSFHAMMENPGLKIIYLLKSNVKTLVTHGLLNRMFVNKNEFMLGNKKVIVLDADKM